MQFENLENEKTELINRLKYDFEKFKSSMIKSIQKVEIQFQEVIAKITMPKLFIQNICKDQESLQNVHFYKIFVQEVNKAIYTQQSNIIFNKLSNRIKVWLTRLNNMFHIKINRILQINENVSFNKKFTQASLTLQNDKTIQLSQGQNNYCFALFDQPVNYNRISHFLIKKIIKFVGIGFANSQVIETNQYKNKLENVNHGAYLCFADKVIMHHGDPTKNNTNIGIIMEVGDIIELIFNPFEKSITWKNLNNDQQYSTVIDNINQELRGCVVMKHKDTKVQIGDDEFMLE